MPSPEMMAHSAEPESLTMMLLPLLLTSDSDAALARAVPEATAPGPPRPDPFDIRGQLMDAWGRFLEGGPADGAGRLHRVVHLVRATPGAPSPDGEA